MNKLNFTSIEYKKKALQKRKVNYENEVTSYDSFFICINGLPIGCLDNLCRKLQIYFHNNSNLNFYYEKIQDLSMPKEFKEIALNCAYEVLELGMPLGTQMVPNTNFNASSWISHSLYEGKLASELALSIGLNPDTAKKLGILHDIGRKKTHNFSHTILGYELLIDIGLENEAICCLTHSFLSDSSKTVLKGNRCANCDSALEGFYINEDGEGVLESSMYKDDITEFLEIYEYNMYDVIINISDLMAASNEITTPYDRVADIATRKTPDPKNRTFFILSFVNSLYSLLYKITADDKYIKYYKLSEKYTNETLEKLFKEASEIFMQEYNKIKH